MKAAISEEASVKMPSPRAIEEAGFDNQVIRPSRVKSLSQK